MVQQEEALHIPHGFWAHQAGTGGTFDQSYLCMLNLSVGLALCHAILQKHADQPHAVRQGPCLKGPCLNCFHTRHLYTYRKMLCCGAGTFEFKLCATNRAIAREPSVNHRAATDMHTDSLRAYTGPASENWLLVVCHSCELLQWPAEGGL